MEVCEYAESTSTLEWLVDSSNQSGVPFILMLPLHGTLKAERGRRHSSLLVITSLTKNAFLI